MCPSIGRPIVVDLAHLAVTLAQHGYHAGNADALRVDRLLNLFSAHISGWISVDMAFEGV